MHIGKRKIKSVLAVFAAFWLWQLVRIPFPGLEVHPIFIYIYSIIEIRDTSEKTVDFGKKRIKSTLVGLGMGMPLLAACNCIEAHLSSQNAKVATELGLLLIGVLITLLIAEKVGCQTFTGLAATIFVVLMVSGGSGDPYVYAVLRAFQTIAGVFVAWLINVKLFPYHGETEASAAEPNIETHDAKDEIQNN